MSPNFTPCGNCLITACVPLRNWLAYSYWVADWYGSRTKQKQITNVSRLGSLHARSRTGPRDVKQKGKAHLTTQRSALTMTGDSPLVTHTSQTFSHCIPTICSTHAGLLCRASEGSTILERHVFELLPARDILHTSWLACPILTTRDIPHTQATVAQNHSFEECDSERHIMACSGLEGDPRVALWK